MTGKEKMIDEYCPSRCGLDDLEFNICDRTIEGRCADCWKQALEKEYER